MTPPTRAMTTSCRPVRFGSGEFGDAPGQAEAASTNGGGDRGGCQAPPGGSNGVVFNRIGQMTRQLHDTLRELGYDQALQRAAEAIPDAASASAISRR